MTAEAALSPCSQPHQVRLRLLSAKNHHGRGACLLSAPAWHGLGPGTACFGPDAVRIRARSAVSRENHDLVREERDPHGWLRLLKDHLEHWESRHERPDGRIAAELAWMLETFERHGDVEITAQARRARGLTPSCKLAAFKEPDPGQGGFW